MHINFIINSFKNILYNCYFLGELHCILFAFRNKLRHVCCSFWNRGFALKKSIFRTSALAPMMVTDLTSEKCLPLSLPVQRSMKPIVANARSQ